VVYPNSRSTEIRSRLSIRSTCPAAYDRLDLLSIVSFDRELGTETVSPPAACRACVRACVRACF
jgi:hypothetical protein